MIPLVVLSPAAVGAPLPTLGAVGLAVLAGLLGNVGNQLLARAYAAAEAQALGVLEFTALPWAALFGWVFFGEAVRPQVWAGAAEIFAACLWVGRGVAPGVKSPALWGTKTRLEELFGETAQEIRTTQREFVFRYRSPAHWIEVFRTYYGPMNKTFGALDAGNQAAFTQDMLVLMGSRNRSNDPTLVLPSEYLEVVIERKR